MSFIVKAPQEQFPTAPAGTFPAVCVDVVDLGLVENRFEPESEPRQMVRLIWQLDEEDKDGKPLHGACRLYGQFARECQAAKDLGGLAWPGLHCRGVVRLRR